MGTKKRAMRIGVKVLVSLGLGACHGHAQSEIVFAELGGVQLVSKPIDLPREDYVATIIEARAIDPSAKITTYTNISISGEVHQVHGPLTSAQHPIGNAFEEAPSNVYHETWIDFDTHLKLTEEMIEGGSWMLQERNDGRFGTAQLPLSFVIPPKAGIGELQFASLTDEFSLAPEFQLSSIDFAYVVTPLVDGFVPDDAVQLTLGLRGTGIIDQGELGGAAFGYNGNSPLNVPFVVPEPSHGFVGFVLIGLMTRWHSTRTSKF